LPSLVLAFIAIANPRLFNRVFMKVFLLLNLFLVYRFVFDLGGASQSIAKATGLMNLEGVDRMIWLSRGLGINILYLVLTSAVKRRPLVYVPLCLLLFAIMMPRISA